MSSRPARFGQNEARKELHNIAQWWLDNTFDTHHGGFVGEIDYQGQAVKGANKGIILNSRVLWFFSELCLFENRPEYRAAADRAFRYLVDRFHDNQYGGTFWELAADGSLVDGKKQIYSLCFSIYGLATYYRLTSDRDALRFALDYFKAIETHARDREFGGYFEAFSQQWKTLSDVRLSDEDMNAPKTMNTHLHLLEAYTALYQVAPSAETEEALRYTISLFCEHIIDRKTGHLRLFFDTQWNSLSPVISYGHDIETSWLLWEAAEVLGDPEVLAVTRPIVVHMADTCLRDGVADTGHLYDAYNPQTDALSESSVWWVQTEALIGFLHAFKLTGEPRYRDACEKTWRYIHEFHIDHLAGEWHWLSNASQAEIQSKYKVGFWKSPYHNGRAMMNIYALFAAFKET